MGQPTLAAAVSDLGGLLPAVAALEGPLARTADAFLAAWKDGKKVLTCGNGGSAADAIHLAEELMVRFQKARKALAAISLLDAGSITCAGNDFGFEKIFSRQVEALGNPGDVLVVFSTSGNSPNIIAAVEVARQRGLVTVAFLGRDGGKLRGACDHELLVPAKTSHRAQECHLLLYHTLCEIVDFHVD